MHLIKETAEQSQGSCPPTGGQVRGGGGARGRRFFVCAESRKEGGNSGQSEKEKIGEASEEKTFRSLGQIDDGITRPALAYPAEEIGTLDYLKPAGSHNGTKTPPWGGQSELRKRW